MDLINNLVNKMIEWVDNSFSIFSTYSGQYSRYLVYALLLLVASKIFKVRVNLDTKRGK